MEGLSDGSPRYSWQLQPQPFSASLFYLTATDVSAALNATSGSQSAAGATAPKTAPATGSAPKDAGAPNPSNKTSPPPGSSPGAESASPSASAQKSSVAVAPLLSDRLVFSDTNPGDDELIAEKNRIIALDLPRPEMIISAWVLQNSSTDGQAVGNFNDIVQRTVARNNDALQIGVLNAWRFLKDMMNDPAGAGYFDPLFYRYVVNRSVADFSSDHAGSDIRSASEDYLSNRSDTGSKPSRQSLGFCAVDEYCLGYVDLFRPLEPRLTDLLLAVAAANTPSQIVGEAAYWMENPGLPYPPATNSTPRTQEGEELRVQYRKDLTKKLDLDDPKNKFRVETCETKDLRLLTGGASIDQPNGIKLTCFRQAARELLGNSSSSVYRSVQPSPVGLLRAAIADFLFNYKMSIQYPHEFSAYDLGRSADVLNSALRPLIESFNRDVRTFQRFLGAELEVELDAFNKNHRSKLFFQDKPDFVNNGLVTVRTISGQETTVDTISQSFLDASSAPQIADLAKSILGQSNSGDSSGTGSGKPSGAGAAGKASSAASGILEGLTPVQVQAILGALSAYQSSKVQIGRELSLDVSPRSLNGAVSAEVAVKLNASETAPPNYWGGTQNGKPADLSRVGTHSTSTRVRVDSIKLFDVSAFTAVLERSRSRFPLLPPLVEIPYLGTLVGVPLPRAKEYHSSTALLSAIVVPAAADLASVAMFRPDAIVEPAEGGSCIWPGATKAASREPEKYCSVRRAISLADLNQPVVEFHRAMVHCMATNWAAARVNSLGEPTAICQNLTFGDVLHLAP